ncbi:conserved hypothetical protein [Chlamydia pneumoniae LPCoLN]|uniref:hypothetical protein n=1 Tax=Chlamydia pneumoniae TaxID=83558 RepID=UPI0001BD9E24|nr:hypothetical protein [Chlamydia pneumoniae]ACZ33559.1 conserved hypothetical protein [Chlamydia pneumoniae LPCoLN]
MILRISTVSLLTSCSFSKNSRTCFVTPERITSQKDCPVLLHPKSTTISPPLYDWISPNREVITAYSFYCRGQGNSIITPEGVLYDCDGLHHSITKEEFRYIHPRLIEVVRLLQQDHPKVSIIEAFCCPKHFHFLEASGISLSQLHLEGTAATFALDPPLPMEKLLATIKKLYTKNSDPSLTNFIVTEATLTNPELRLTQQDLGSHTEITVEILDNLQNKEALSSA